MKRTKKLNGIKIFDIVVTTLVLLVTFLLAYPLYYCLIASISDPIAVSAGETMFWIKGFTLDSYRLILDEDQLWVGYRNTIFYTFFGTLYNLVLTIPAAYVVSKKHLPWRGVISWYYFITMYIGGGLIPSYLLIRDLKMLNTPWVFIIGAGVSCYNLIVTRQYFSTSIHPDIYEAAYIDGAGEGYTFCKIALPLAKPIIAVMALYYGVAHWNDWYTGLVYANNKELQPLQLVLRNILMAGDISVSPQFGSGNLAGMEYAIYRARMVLSMKYSIVIVASIPLLIAYPFLQKYFVKGVMIGSVKG